MASVKVDETFRLTAPGARSVEWRFATSSGRGRPTSWLFFLVLLFFPLFAHSVQLIAHESVPVTQLTLKELRAIYAMRLDEWDNGLRIQVFVQPPRSDAHQRFCKSVLQVLPHQLQAAWYRMVYSGMGRGPMEVRDARAMIEHVRNTPGAIGYLESIHAVSGEQAIKTIQIIP